MVKKQPARKGLGRPDSTPSACKGICRMPAQLQDDTEPKEGVDLVDGLTSRGGSLEEKGATHTHAFNGCG